uniref:Uncharacterized protein n=1 Tax=Ananas comosus var. bracteatus TaxID=296719 RepID=A0A6V7NSM9_ANACO|nr:unnamed protein product [Ananas comosus var. bracteatus]
MSPRPSLTHDGRKAVAVHQRRPGRRQSAGKVTEGPKEALHLWPVVGPNELLLLVGSVVTFGIRASSPAKSVWRVSAEPGSKRQGDRLCRSLNDKVTCYVRVRMTRLARRVSHRLAILGCVCDWTDEDVKAFTGGSQSVTFELLPPPVSHAYFKSMHSHRCGPSSSQHLPASTPAAIKGERPVSQETQAIPKHHKGINFEDLNQIAALSHL